MKNIIGTIIILFISLISFIISYFQFKERGFVFNNSYIYATKKERNSMNKKPLYRESSIVFFLFGIAFLSMGLSIITNIIYFIYLTYSIFAIVVGFVVIKAFFKK